MLGSRDGLCHDVAVMVSSGGISSALRRIGRSGPNADEMELLRAALLDVPEAAAAWRRWSAGHVVDDAYHRSVDLLPAVSANLPADVLGAEADRLRGLRRRAWADSQFRLEAVVGGAAVLEPLGIRPIVVKGAALSTTVYREAGIRPMADVDLLVGADRFDEAMSAFLAAGWDRPLVTDSPFDHAVAVVDAYGHPIDVHRWVVFPRFAAEPESAWVERAVPHCVRGCEVLRFRCSDELVLAVLHGLLTNSPSSVRWPLDVVQVARHGAEVEGVGTDAFWAEVVESASAMSVGPIVADALEMCRVEFGAPIPQPVVAELSSGRLDPGLAQHWALCRRGVTLEWRVRRYVKLERLAGRRPTVSGYVRPPRALPHARVV